MKTCTKCGGDPKPVAEFSKCARARDGLQWYCKVCVKAYDAQYRPANREKERLRAAKYSADHREERNAASAQWAADNPEARCIREQNRRARKRKAGGELSKGLAERLYTLQRGKCACSCKQPLGEDYHLDHIMPLALGGTNTDDNIQLLRQRCNNQKHAKHPIDFMQSRGFLL